MKPVILHSDMNNFYASVEILYDPKLRDKPVAVAGDEEARQGIVLAKTILPNGSASAPARYFGRPDSSALAWSVFQPIMSATWPSLPGPGTSIPVTPTRWSLSVWTSAGWMLPALWACSGRDRPLRTIFGAASGGNWG